MLFVQSVAHVIRQWHTFVAADGAAMKYVAVNNQFVEGPSHIAVA